tara:strand:+ start:7608 stop:8606 length:999 start_codon:yes stop_codon:yes gene_type:complete
MVKELIVNKLINDDEIKKLKGNWIDEEYIKYPIIKEDTDVYYYDNDNNKKLLLKFRKNVISDEMCELGWNAYKTLAKPSRGRGASAGPIDPESTYWKKRELYNTNKWSTSYIKNGKKSKMKVNNQVLSTPIGFFESSNISNFKSPCRLTHFTRENFDKYVEGFPFLHKINDLFKELTPDRYDNQFKQASEQPKFQIDNTAFSTVTINRNFRTALHKDANDFEKGFGNLTVLEQGKYSGGYTIFPQYGVAIDLRQNDFAVMDVHQWHANTKIYESKSDIEYNKDIISDFKDNPKIGTNGIYTKYTRLTFVCYLREKLINCDKNNINEKLISKN